ncbi:hypothetical protein ROD_40941 [Citrobacter rodentium ICC168]|uniref:Uncharacterized protein n=1 Tax=Citrobacter rodentium (strain ICC168) TaxID=637910 RepID=D2TI18_CITRI|nr:hypothetical protein ROD_40941 [Citrobacter rodentium ICC168]
MGYLLAPRSQCRSCQISCTIVDGVAIEYSAATLRHKDQIDMHLKNTVPSVSNIDKTSITLYIINDGILSSLTQFMQENQWRVQLTPYGDKTAALIRHNYSGQHVLACRYCPETTQKPLSTNHITQHFSER